MTSVARLRLNNIVTCLNEAMETLDVIAKSLETPFLAPICTITRTLVTSVQVIAPIESSPVNLTHNFRM